MTAQPASDWPALADDEVHVWHVPLDLDAVSVDGLARTLSPDERMRATRFARDTDRRRFVTARGIARFLLGGYLDQPPTGVAFAYGSNGKPEVAVTSGRPAIRFNYAHTGGRMLLAVRQSGRIGIDVEAMRPLTELDLLIRSVCTDGERAALDVCTAADRLAAFLRCWTRKEAVLKAMGEGLARPAVSIEVSLARRAERLLVAIDGDVHAALRWSLRPVPVASGHVAALATEGGDPHVCARQLDDDAMGMIVGAASDHPLVPLLSPRVGPAA